VKGSLMILFNILSVFYGSRQCIRTVFMLTLAYVMPQITRFGGREGGRVDLLIGSDKPWFKILAMPPPWITQKTQIDTDTKGSGASGGSIACCNIMDRGPQKRLN
jgi:hypothetical protein